MTIKLREYLSKIERTYTYRIKAVFPLDDLVMDRIERILARYIPVKIGQATKTIHHRNPLDFPNVSSAEVYTVEVELELPASPYVVQLEIVKALKVPEKFVVVRGANEPVELENEQLNAKLDAEEKGVEPTALLNDAEYSEVSAVPGDELYGDKHNGRLLDYMKKAATERAKESVVAHKPFEYLTPKQEPTSDNFNDGQEGIKPASRKSPKKGK